MRFVRFILRFCRHPFSTFIGVFRRIFLNERFISFSTRISPWLNTQLRSIQIYGRMQNLRKPKTFVEKLLFLKLKHFRDEKYVKCADKYAVREHVSKLGLGYILNELYGVYECAEDIPWKQLPEKFVVKWNFGSGYNILCRDKKHFDIDNAIKQLTTWRSEEIWLSYSEMQYKYAPKKIICERFLEPEGQEKSLTDYKVYCFNGTPRAILVMSDRDDNMSGEFFDVEWNPLESNLRYRVPDVPHPKPALLGELLKVSSKLSADFCFVRCDFYINRGRIILGEMTFTPAGCFWVSQAKINGKQMGDFLETD